MDLLEGSVNVLIKRYGFYGHIWTLQDPDHSWQPMALPKSEVLGCCFSIGALVVEDDRFSFPSDYAFRRAVWSVGRGLRREADNS